MPTHNPFLYLLSRLYDAVTAFRNHRFDSGKKRMTVFEVPTIAVGNLSWGGTGKTPMIEFLITLFQERYRLAVLSRGYGRKTQGFLLADQTTDAKKIGDEPFQIYTKFGKKVSVAVGEQRVLAIPELLALRQDTDLILLDDAYQHRYVKADFYILLTTFQKPFFEDHVIPLGTLRENRSGAKRADLIVVTKCPLTLNSDQKNAYKKNIVRYTEGKQVPIVFSTLKYGSPYPVSKAAREWTGQVLLVSGIADDTVLKKEVEKRYSLQEVITFGDHHRYTSKDLQLMLEKIKKNKDWVVLTTEKDITKLNVAAFSGFLEEIPIFALPMMMTFDATDQQFVKECLQTVVEDKLRNGEAI
ncbi:tetraacyldisaccharide 4'-kinase [Mongoliitalea daihaiensis]|uniref:tetraacyldisaccharide 4'-kinase n=1 Tax=Mongoliitalea daihaiensis TaxID=2782006 RepID=UPI001F242E0D|nr:tetraacyldisaccharide 4'-kinase [Mongoliitalea daihaiensis]UJP63244.1 tetraacyldisaccharide 4'-kinase [Mongoliitalea daihaiensis]